jgi:putative cardiolipin synthase
MDYRRALTFLSLLLLVPVTASRADHVRLLDDPIEAWQARVDLIQQAESSIEVEYYAVHYGDIAMSFIGLLEEAADRGVRVRVLLDGFANGLAGKHPGALGVLLTHPNIEVRFYHMFTRSSLSKWDKRLHDKILLVDDSRLITGGRNMGDKYFGRTEKGKPQSLDRDIFILGDLEKDDIPMEVNVYFNSLWDSDVVGTLRNWDTVRGNCFSWSTGSSCGDVSRKLIKRTNREREKIHAHLDRQRAEKPEAFNTGNQWLDGSVDVDHLWFIHNPLFPDHDPFGPAALFDMAFQKAGSYMLAQSPYVIPENTRLKSISQFTDKGVDFQVITNSIASTPNAPAFAGYKRYRKRMLETGIQFYEYQGPHNVHHKAFVIDDRWSMVGSLNLDPRSFNKNTEMIYVMDDPEFAAMLKESMQQYIDRSVLVTREGVRPEDVEKIESVGFMKRVMINVLAFFSPLYRNQL